MITRCPCPRCQFNEFVTHARALGLFLTTRSRCAPQPQPVEIFVHPRGVRPHAVYRVAEFPNLPAVCTGFVEGA